MPSVGLPPSPASRMIVFRLPAARLRPRAAKPQSGRRAGEAGLDLVQKLITHATEAHPGARGENGRRTRHRAGAGVQPLNRHGRGAEVRPTELPTPGVLIVRPGVLRSMRK